MCCGQFVKDCVCVCGERLVFDLMVVYKSHVADNWCTFGCKEVTCAYYRKKCSQVVIVLGAV